MSREKYANRGASDEMKMTVAGNIKHYLAVRGKTQLMMAQDFGRPQTSISAWCIGQSLPSITQMKEIAEYLGITLEDLITSPEEKVKAEKVKGYTDTDIEIAKHIGKLSNKDKQLIYAIVNRLAD